MQYFCEKDLLQSDELLKDIEHHAQDNADLLKRLDRYSISVKGDLTEMKAVDPRSEAYVDHARRVMRR